MLESAEGAIHMPDAIAFHMLHEEVHTLHAVFVDFIGSVRVTLHVSLVEPIHMLPLAGNTLHTV